MGLPRIRELRKNANLTQKQLADKIYVDKSTVTKWETGKALPDAKKQDILASFFNVSLDYLMGRCESNTEPVSYESSGVLRIPVYGYIPAGVPMEAIEDILDYEEAPEDWSLGGKEFFGLKIKGDSMEPEYRDGDIIIFLKQPDCENNEDCAVSINGNDWTFKRVEKLESGLLIKPLNPNYETLFFTPQQCIDLPVEVKGVFWELRRSKIRKK